MAERSELQLPVTWLILLCASNCRVSRLSSSKLKQEESCRLKIKPCRNFTQVEKQPQMEMRCREYDVWPIALHCLSTRKFHATGEFWGWEIPNQRKRTLVWSTKDDVHKRRNVRKPFRLWKFSLKLSCLKTDKPHRVVWTVSESSGWSDFTAKQWWILRRD